MGWGVGGGKACEGCAWVLACQKPIEREGGWPAPALLATQPERHISAESKPPHPPPSASIQAEFKSPSREAVEIFKSILEERRVPVSVRITRGLEAAAACGQLRNMYQKTPLQEFEVPA